MNDDILKGKWNEMKGKVKQKWSKLTDDDMLGMEGSTEELSGKLQKIYGYKKEEAQDHIDTFLKDNSDSENK